MRVIDCQELGMDPESWLSYTLKYSILVNVLHAAGNVPDTPFPCKSRIRKAVRALSPEDRVPEMELLGKLMAVTSVPVHVMPNQLHRKVTAGTCDQPVLSV